MSLILRLFHNPQKTLYKSLEPINHILSTIFTMIYQLYSMIMIIIPHIFDRFFNFMCARWKHVKIASPPRPPRMGRNMNQQYQLQQAEDRIWRRSLMWKKTWWVKHGNFFRTTKMTGNGKHTTYFTVIWGWLILVLATLRVLIDVWMAV